MCQWRRTSVTEGDDPNKFYADPNAIEHQQAPGGEMYALIDKTSKTAVREVELSMVQLCGNTVEAQCYSGCFSGH